MECTPQNQSSGVHCIITQMITVTVGTGRSVFMIRMQHCSGWAALPKCPYFAEDHAKDTQRRERWMTFWTPAKTESLQAPPHWKCGGISNNSHRQKDLTTGVHTQQLPPPPHTSPIYLFMVLFISHVLGSFPLRSNRHLVQRYTFYYTEEVNQVFQALLPLCFWKAAECKCLLLVLAGENQYVSA